VLIEKDQLGVNTNDADLDQMEKEIINMDNIAPTSRKGDMGDETVARDSDHNENT
jgi:hypothetical protein